MSYFCKLSHNPTDYPCSEDCPLFGDCVATYAKYRSLCKNEEDKKTSAANIAVKRNDKGEFVEVIK